MVKYIYRAVNSFGREVKKLVKIERGSVGHWIAQLHPEFWTPAA